jgi:hypothetical protein
MKASPARRPGGSSYEFGRQHPVLVAALTCAVFTGLAVLFAVRLALARRAVPAGWAPAAAIGAAAGVALVSLGVARRTSLTVVWVVSIGFLAEFIYALNAGVPASGYRVTVTINAGAYAFAIVTSAAAVLLFGWAGWISARRSRGAYARPPGDQAAGMGAVSPGERGDHGGLLVFARRRWRGWEVFWLDAGERPALRRVRAASLSAAVEQATFMVAGKVRDDVTAGLKLYFAVTPRHPGGPGLQVSGEPGAFTVTDPQYGPLHGATLDDLVAAVRLVRGQKADFTMVWERLLPAPARPDSEWS